MRDQCKACGGKQVCPHSLMRVQCRDCLSADQLASSKRFCVRCFNALGLARQRASIRLCGTCSRTAPARIEHTVRDRLLPLVMHEPSMEDNVRLGGGGCDAPVRRADLGWLAPDRAVFFEVDEHSHHDREASCELGKLWDQTVAVKRLLGEHARVFMVRFNPDEYDGGRVTLDERVRAAAALVNELIATDVSAYDAMAPHVWYMYYHSKSMHLMDAARARPDAVHVVSALPAAKI